MIRIALAAALTAGLAGGAAAQQTQPAPAEGEAAAMSDCAFLERSFQQVYEGMRERRGQQGQEQGQGDPAMVTMFVTIQNNIIMLHTARGCDVSNLIMMARQEADQYSDIASWPPGPAETPSGR